jgi:hypothetical protein
MLLFTGISTNESYLTLMPSLIVFSLSSAMGFAAFNIVQSTAQNLAKRASLRE